MVQYTGERLYCMSYVSQKIRQKYDKPRFEDVMEYLKRQTAFTMPEIISEIVRSFMQTHEKLFYLLRMLNGRVPVDMCMDLKYAQLLKAGIKETQGNSAALKVFEAASEALPNSHMLRIGYLSHLACILLPSDPQKSYEYYCEIIELVNNGQTFCDFPFHEYGDKAMCKVLLKEADKALAHAKVGIRYAESHGVFDEVGRILNIKGCAYLLSNNILKAVKCFREATEIMGYSGYNLYRWRSEMNYVNYAVHERHFQFLAQFCRNTSAVPIYAMDLLRQSALLVYYFKNLLYILRMELPQPCLAHRLVVAVCQTIDGAVFVILFLVRQLLHASPCEHQAPYLAFPELVKKLPHVSVRPAPLVVSRCHRRISVHRYYYYVSFHFTSPLTTDNK